MQSRFTTRMLIAAVLVCTLISRSQVQRWRDSNTLFGYTLTVNPDSLLSHNIIGYLAARSGRFHDAEVNYKAALRIWPQDAEIYFDLGNLYLARRPDLAEAQYRLAVRYRPGMAIYHNSLGAALARLGNPAEAYDQWKQAISLDPGYVDPHNNLGDLCANAGHADAAREEYNAALQIDPGNRYAQAKLKGLPR